MREVRAARPDARLVADANEAWTPDLLRPLLDVAAETGFELIEQPLPAGADALLAKIPHPVPFARTRSCIRPAIGALADRYDAVNIKLDKAGGLTEALAMSGAARRLGLQSMVGCMVATSLAMAPAFSLRRWQTGSISMVRCYWRMTGRMALPSQMGALRRRRQLFGVSRSDVSDL